MHASATSLQSIRMNLFCRYCVANNMQQQLAVAPDEVAQKDKGALPWLKNPSVALPNAAF